jgi:hypothetical protein
MALISLLATAQNPPKLYPYGDEFPLGLYAISKEFADASAWHWNNGHIYRHYIYIDSNNDTVIYYASQGNTYLDNPRAPIPQSYFDVCKANDMNAKARISTYENSAGIHSPVDSLIIEAEIDQQSTNTNLSWWGLPEDMRWGKQTERAIIEEYTYETRDHDPSQRPNYMYIAGYLLQEAMVNYVEYLDIIPVSCYPEYAYINNTWPDPRGVPHSYVRWAIERTQKEITEPTPNGAEMKIGKDYLNGEKTITAILEMFRNIAKVRVVNINPLLSLLNPILTINEIQIPIGDKVEVGTTVEQYLYNGVWHSNAQGWEIDSLIFDQHIKPKHTWHDFWLALACDVQGIELFSHSYAVKGNSFHGHLEAAWDSLNIGVGIFKDNDMDKVQLNGIMDTTIDFNIISGPDSTEYFYFEPTTSQGGVPIQYSSIKLQAKKWMGDTYIIAVNSTDSTVVYEMPISTMGNQNGVPLVVENLIQNSTQTLTSNLYGGILAVRDTLPPLGVSVFKYKSSTTLDLSMRDCLNDNGYDAGYRKDLEDIDNSPDIWVRNTNDGHLNKEHESPTYSQQDPLNYVYVRVKNISSEPSSGNETLKLYWAKNGMHPQWPIMWDGSTPNVGNLISSQTIPILQANEDTILEFEWTIIPDSTGEGDWGHCLLARIENTNGKDEIQDYFNSNGDHRLSKEVYNNNNISLRNCEIIHNPIIQNFADLDHKVKKTLNLGNSSSIGDFYDITFQVPQFYRTSSLMDNIAVSVKFDAQGWSLFQNSINNTEGLNISGEHEINLTGFETTFESIYLPANTELPTTLTFDFLIQNDSTAEYEFLVSSQTSIADDNGEYWRSNVRYIVRNNPRDPPLIQMQEKIKK